jgi:hypothetical protein
MTFEKEYEAVLQSLESAIAQVYQASPELVDLQVQTAINYLVRIYNAEAQGKTASPPHPKGISGEVADSVQVICELHLGRAELEDEAGQPLTLDIPAKTASEIVACLKRIDSSIKFWNKKSGRQGYLDFINGFFTPL